jgi:hypothetical protein
MDVGEIPEGGYAKVSGKWWVRPPGRRRAAVITGEHHEVIEHDDGTITVSPSIVFSTPDRDDYWHGWLRHGEWVEV